MSQTFLHLYGPDRELSALGARLKEDGFAVGPAKVMAGGIYVRVRPGTDDEESVLRAASEVAPAAKRGPGAVPATDIPAYREGR